MSKSIWIARFQKGLLLCAKCVCVSLAIAGCQTPQPEPPELVADRSKLAEGPPKVQGLATETASAEQVTLDPVKIQPETSVGYGQLPTSITQLNQGTTVSLSLADVVDLTLANERGLKIQGYALRIAQYEVPVNKGIYDLLLQGSVGYQRIEEQTGRNTHAEGNQRFGFFGLSQLLPSGAIIDFTYDVAREASEFVMPATLLSSGSSGTRVEYPQTATLSASQPLLRGFGPAITNAPIRIAQIEERGAAADYQTNLERTLTETLSLYWELIGAIELYKVRVISYSAARDLLRVNTAKYEAGVLPQTDVLQAQAAAEGRRDDLIQTRQSVRDIEDDLKRMIFLQSGRPNWPMEISPTQPIAWREMQVDLDGMVATALDARSELRRARSNIDRERVAREVARNNMLPQLNVSGSVNANAVDDNFDDSGRTLRDSRYNSYSIGLDASYPLQNRAARHRHGQREAAVRQAEESLLELQDRITLEVRQATRALRTARERIDVTQSAVVSEAEKLRSQQRRYEVGISTAFEVLTFQQDLANAQAQHINAVIEYNIATIQLERARGMLLDTYGVSVRGADLNPEIKPVGFPIGWD